MDKIDIDSATKAKDPTRFLVCIEQAFQCGHYKQVPVLARRRGLKLVLMLAD